MLAPLTLPQNLMLLALNDEGGISHNRQYGDAILAGAIAELILRHLVTEGPAGEANLQVCTPSDTHSPFLDQCLATIAKAETPQSASDWIDQLGHEPDWETGLITELVALGALVPRKKRVLGLFDRTVYAEARPLYENKLKQEMQNAISSTSHRVETRLGITITLAKAAGLLPHIFEKSFLKRHKGRIREISSGTLIVAETPEAEAAVSLAILLPTIMAAATLAIT